MAKFAQLYIKEIVRLHGVPSNLVSDKDTRYTSRFWQTLQSALCSKLTMSLTYHPRPMVSLREQTNRLRIFCERACWITWVLGMKFCP